MSEFELAQDAILVGESEYIEVINRVITEAQQTLCVFDQDFSIGDFSSVQRFTLLESFLSKNTLNTLTITLHNTEFFSTQCSRLMHLLTTFSHQMTVHQTNSYAKIANDCFILADDKAYIRRFHIDQARFKYALNDAETTASLANRFDELMQETTHTIATTTLGL